MARPRNAKRPQTPEEWAMVRRALIDADGNQTGAADALGVSRRTLVRWLADAPEIRDAAATTRADARVSGPR